MHCGLLGRKLGHSYSPQIHRCLGAYDYALFEKEPEDLESFLRQGIFRGLNVTIPYKKAVIPFCDTLTPIAEKLGAVNTIIRNGDGSLTGHNTDYFGFKSMLQKSGLCVANKKVLVLGSGGASNTVVSVLKEHGANVVVISRNGENNYKNIDKHADAAVIVNATPVGMYPETLSSPVDISIFPNLEGVLDLIYNPANTMLMQQTQKRNLVAVNGLWMLVAQAKESAEWFTDNTLPDNKISEIYNQLSLQMRNIVLIGMPGCGKSTIGQQLASKLNKPFVDSDSVIVNQYRKSIPQIFKEDGEAVFRSYESTVLDELGKESGNIIATGGGCVTVSKNYPALHQNSIIIWIRRNVAILPTDGRPLSQGNDLLRMYEIRKPLYEAFADYVVDNNEDIESTVAAIQAILTKELTV